DGVALDGVADVGLSGGRHRIAKDGDTTSTIELDQVAGPGHRATDQVERHARFVGLGRPQRRAEAVGAAQDDAVQQIAYRGDAVDADAGDVALDDVALTAVVRLDAGAVKADDIASPGHRAADGVAVAAGDLDAEQVVALGRARGGGRLRAVAHAAHAVGG